MKVSSLSTLAFVSAVIGQAVLHPNTHTHKCLDVRDNIHKNGNPVQINDCHTSDPAQLWNLKRGLTTVQLTNTNFCLDATETPTNGTKMRIWECANPVTAAQQWYWTPDDRIALYNKGYCLDLTNGDLTSGNVMQVWHCTSGDVNQIWRN